MKFLLSLNPRKPVIEICNGFQTLVKSGILPGNDVIASGDCARNDSATLTLTYKDVLNAAG